jgi:hypothetical protein
MPIVFGGPRHLDAVFTGELNVIWLDANALIATAAFSRAAQATQAVISIVSGQPK